MTAQKIRVVHTQNQQEQNEKAIELHNLLRKIRNEYMKWAIYEKGVFKISIEIPFTDINVIRGDNEGLVIWLKNNGGGLNFDFVNKQLVVFTDNTNWRSMSIKDSSFSIDSNGIGIYIETEESPYVVFK